MVHGRALEDGRRATTTLELEVDHGESHEEWDAWVGTTPGGHHLQTAAWAYVKAAAGWRATRVLLRSRGELVGGCQLLVRALPGVGSVAYVPRGPLLASRDRRLLDAMFGALRTVARREHLLYLKIQPPVDRVDLPVQLQARGLVASDLHTAPVASVLVDLQANDEDGLFKAMRSTTRRRVRQAEKHGVEVRVGGETDLPVLQTLLEATARRQGFDPYPIDYYRRLWAAFGRSGHARLLIAEREGAALSAALLIGFGDTVIYKIGAWGGMKGSPPGSNELMHWSGIRWARESGFRSYDFEGIPLEVAGEVLAGGESTSEHGVAFFKLGFGGSPVVFPGTFDGGFGTIAGPVLQRLVPRAQHWHKAVHLISGRRG